MSGWDLQKALFLLRKSNPPLLEWLGSPIIYLEEYSTASRMGALAARRYSPAASAYHYLHMAKGNYWEYSKGESVKIRIIRTCGAKAIFVQGRTGCAVSKRFKQKIQRLRVK